LAQADVLVFVASEGGSTWGFAQTLQDALSRAGHRVHTGALENFQITPATRQVFVLAATYGEGQAPAHASQALERIAKLDAGAVPVTVLGFGDRQFPAFCAFAKAVDDTLRARGWPALLPLECIHQQSGQQFARWGDPGTGLGRKPGAGACAACAAHRGTHARVATGLPRCHRISHGHPALCVA
jgi:sulfite reductase (NADPH) flavoprotein alpha-component